MFRLFRNRYRSFNALDSPLFIAPILIRISDNCRQVSFSTHGIIMAQRQADILRLFVATHRWKKVAQLLPKGAGLRHLRWNGIDKIHIPTTESGLSIDLSDLCCIFYERDDTMAICVIKSTEFKVICKFAFISHLLLFPRESNWKSDSVGQEQRETPPELIHIFTQNFISNHTTTEKPHVVKALTRYTYLT